MDAGNRINPEISKLVHKIDRVEKDIENPELCNRLDHLRLELLSRDTGQLDEDRISFPMRMFKPENGEHIKDMWSDFLGRNRDSFLSLYIHIPFCFERRCNYCVYYSTILETQDELERYLTYLEKQMEFFSPLFSNNRFTTLYVGGGTPSIFNPSQLERLFKATNKNFDIDPKGQLTFEMSPGTTTKEKIDVVKKNGFNRVSLGIQSLDKEVLEKNNRTYIPYRRLKSLFDYIKGKGFEGFDVDLMLGLRGDTEEKFLEGLDKLLKLGPYSIALSKMVYACDITDFFREKFPNQKGNVNITESYTPAGYSMSDVFKKVGPLLEKYGYVCGHCSQYTTPILWKTRQMWLAALNRWYLPYYNASTHNSVLGLGIGAESYITYELEYRNIDNVKGDYSTSSTEYYVHELKPKNQMRQYLLSVVCSQSGIPIQISTTDFEEKFEKDILKEFKDELNILDRMEIARKYKDTILLFPRNDYEKAFATKIFHEEYQIEDKNRVPEKKNYKRKIERKIRADWEEKFGECPSLSNDLYPPFGKPDKHVIDFIEGNHIKPPKRILDLGCGNGRNAVYFTEKGFDAYGIDLSNYAIKFAKDNVENAKFYLAYAQKLPFKHDSFDVVIDAGTIHVNPYEEREYIIDEVYRILKLNGFFFTRLFMLSDVHPKKIDLEGIKCPTWGFTLGDILDMFQKKFKIFRIIIAPHYVEPIFFVWMKKMKKTVETMDINKLSDIIEYDYHQYIAKRYPG